MAAVSKAEALERIGRRYKRVDEAREDLEFARYELFEEVNRVRLESTVTMQEIADVCGVHRFQVYRMLNYGAPSYGVSKV